MSSVYDNGGMIGTVLDLDTTEQYITGTTTATPSFVGATTLSGSGAISLTGLGLQEDDVVFVFMADDNNNGGSAPSGWTTHIAENFTNSVYNSVWYKVMGATPDTSVTVPEVSAWVVAAFRGIDTTNIFDVTTVGPNTTTTDPDPPSITTVTDDSMIVVFGGFDDQNRALDVIPPSGYTLAAAEDNDGTTMVAYKLLSTAGTEDPGLFDTGTSDSTVAYTIALRRGSTTSFGNKKNSGIWNLSAVYDVEVGNVIGNTENFVAFSADSADANGLITWTIPAGASNSIDAKMWGGAGGASDNAGTDYSGAGGFAGATIDITGQTSLNIYVGHGGSGAGASAASTPGGVGYGSGGAGEGGGAGGGGSAILFGTTPVLVAGGGGGRGPNSDLNNPGGAGGGQKGQDGESNDGLGGLGADGATGGLGDQSDVGDAQPGGNAPGGDGGQAGGGSGLSGGGGGGGGYAGGGGGGGGTYATKGSGGGGSGYANSTYCTNAVLKTGNREVPGNDSDADLPSGVAVGTNTTLATGPHGYVIIRYYT